MNYVSDPLCMKTSFLQLRPEAAEDCCVDTNTVWEFVLPPPQHHPPVAEARRCDGNKPRLSGDSMPNAALLSDSL
ncbi:hypothetical protein CHARACLAT_032892 [Characodon lateralis]|uniref:Uncharacterized protein n=1 Tax=Characodon lateralis TaxID=208331 RepID=A0ABU7DM86_9TELE|nr:hypothetical protein [Characodon lateralis]